MGKLVCEHRVKLTLGQPFANAGGYGDERVSGIAACGKRIGDLRLDQRDLWHWHTGADCKTLDGAMKLRLLLGCDQLCAGSPEDHPV